MATLENHNTSSGNDSSSETDNEIYSDSDEDIDNENFDELLVYEPEENSLTKYNIVLCELYNPELHGTCDGEINYHYLTIVRFKKFNQNFINSFTENRFCRNEIAQCLYLSSQHCVSIIKTFWLRLIQRNWKKIISERSAIIRKRCNPISIEYREIHGVWPKNCINYPGLKGMLSKLSCSSSRCTF